jgi:Phage capsid protein
MVDTAYQTQYRDEFIAAFEQRVTLLRETVTTEAVIKGNQAVFLVAGSGGATAVTRGANGLIPARSDDLTQNTVTLGEWHDLVRKSGFNIFASQGNQRQIMQQTSMAVVNRKIDDQIITKLNTGTVTVGAASATPTVSLFQNARVKLSNASVPWDSNITLLCQPSVLAFLEQAPEFSNAEYVEVRPYTGSDQNPSWQDKPMAYRWRNTLIIEHPNLPGKATASEKSFLYHKTAIGHAANTGGVMTAVGFNDEQDYTYARTSVFMEALLLQNAGVVVWTTDGTVYG